MTNVDKLIQDTREALLADLVGIAEIAARLNVNSTAAHNWTVRYDDFPVHVVKIGRTPVYLWSEFLAWHLRHFSKWWITVRPVAPSLPKVN